MAQNIYDDPAFFAGYSTLPRSIRGLDGAPEWPSLRAMLPSLAGRRVVDLGCGFGWFCRWAAEQGAAEVLGLDLSERMLERARTDTAGAIGHDRISYRRADLDTLTTTELPSERFDLAYSSLTVHYLSDLGRFLRTVRSSLVPGGALVVSVEHPIFTAPSRPGFTVDDRGRAVWPVDDYLDEGPRTTDWFAPGVVKRHRTIGTYVTGLVAAGFTVTALREWGPSPEQVAEVPEWAVERDRPPFLLLSATR